MSYCDWSFVLIDDQCRHLIGLRSGKEMLGSTRHNLRFYSVNEGFHTGWTIGDEPLVLAWIIRNGQVVAPTPRTNLLVGVISGYTNMVGPVLANGRACTRCCFWKPVAFQEWHRRSSSDLISAAVRPRWYTKRRVPAYFIQL